MTGKWCLILGKVDAPSYFHNHMLKCKAICYLDKYNATECICIEKRNSK